MLTEEPLAGGFLLASLFLLRLINEPSCMPMSSVFTEKLSLFSDDLISPAKMNDYPDREGSARLMNVILYLDPV